MFHRASSAFLISILFSCLYFSGCGFWPSPDSEISQLIEQFSGEYDERRLASKELVKLGSASVPALIKASRSENSMVRWESVNALGYIGSSEAVPALVERVLIDIDAHVRWRSIWALDAVDDGSASSLLLKHLTDDDPNVKWNAAVALSALGGMEAVPILHEGLNTDDPWTRWEAANGLGHTYNEETPGFLISAYEDSTISTRQEIVLSLGRIGTPEVVPALAKALDDEEPQVRWRAAMALEWIGDGSAAPTIRSRLNSETDKSVIEHMEKCLNKISP